MPNYFLQTTLRAAKRVLPSFKHVAINEARSREVAEQIALRNFELPSWNFPGCQPQSNRAFPSHEFFSQAINFCFDWSNRSGDGKIIKFRARTAKTEGIKRVTISGSFAMQACLYRLFGEEPITLKLLSPHIETFSRFKKAFRGINAMPLQKARWEFLRECAEVLRDNFSGDVMNLIEEARYHAFGAGDSPGIVELLVDCFPVAFGGDFYMDRAGHFVPPRKAFCFYKRAQLFALAYHGRAMASCGELRPIEDVSDIGPIVDYILPKRDFADGVLVYDDELRSNIEKAEPIPRHSRKELEIRIGELLVFDGQLRTINDRRSAHGLPPIHTGHLDYYKWSRRDGGRFNHHICLSTDY